MSSSQVNAPQVIHLQASYLLVLCYLTLASVAGIALWWSEMMLLWYLVGSLVLLVYSVYIIMRYCLLLHPKSVIGLSYQTSDNSWMVHLKNQQVLSVTLSSRTIVTRYWVLLQMRSSACRHVAMIVTDSIGGEPFRQLRAHLMWYQ